MPLTEDTGLQAKHTSRVVPLAMAAGANIYMGAMVATNASGWAVPAADVAGHTVVGVAQEHANNTGGGNGARMVLVQKGVFGIHNSVTRPVTQARVGRAAYVEDDGLVADSTVTNNVTAGVVDELGADDLVYVFFG